MLPRLLAPIVLVLLGCDSASDQPVKLDKSSLLTAA